MQIPPACAVLQDGWPGCQPQNLCQGLFADPLVRHGLRELTAGTSRRCVNAGSG